MESQQQTRSRPPSQTGIDKIWVVMGGIFGTKWTNSMGFDPTNANAKIWRGVLRGISDDQIQKALNNYSDTGAKFIPAATEFKALCRYNGSNREQAAFEAQASKFKPYARLTDMGAKERTKAAKEKAMKIMRGEK